MAESFSKYVASILLLNTELTAETDIAKASLSANRIIGMRGTDQVDGKLISLDVGNIGEEDMGVKVQFQNVWFRYPTRDVPILNGLSLTVRKSRFSMKFVG
jgi:ABC-type multidrug transport system fused ATPase/permease subunit